MKQLILKSYATGILILLLTSCQRESPYKEITGETMGSTYVITYKGPKGIKPGIDSILQEFNQLFSTYDENSYLSKFNKNTLTEEEIKQLTERQCKWMTDVFKLSFVLYHKTEKAFNPGMAPLLNFWGFGENSKYPEVIDQKIIDSLLVFSNYDNYYLRGCFPFKTEPRYELNYNAMAAGYATDVIALHLESLEISDYLINITGEMRAKGVNKKGEVWKIGIEKPINNKSQNPSALNIELSDKAMATSGNYRNFFEKNGKKYGHTINPTTGYPSENNMLSATVISKYGAICDGLATAFMVMGFENSKRIVEGDASLEAVLIWEDKGEMKTWSSWDN